jgi:hypothetical protein
VVTALEASHADDRRTITAAEVKTWFGNSRKLSSKPEKYSEIATRLTRLRWPGDPPPAPKADLKSRTRSKSSSGFWNFDAATEAAKRLHSFLPAMILHWQDSPEWSPETRPAYEAIKALDETLSVAMPYIEWPLGRYERQTGQKRPKEWHLYSILIASFVLQALIGAGDANPGISHNSLVVKIIKTALVRINIPGSKTLSTGAIGAHLKRWKDTHGDLVPKPTIGR